MRNFQKFVPRLNRFIWALENYLNFRVWNALVLCVGFCWFDTLTALGINNFSGIRPWRNNSEHSLGWRWHLCPPIVRAEELEIVRVRVWQIGTLYHYYVGILNRVEVTQRAIFFSRQDVSLWWWKKTNHRATNWEYKPGTGSIGGWYTASKTDTAPALMNLKATRCTYRVDWCTQQQHRMTLGLFISPSVCNLAR